MEEEDIQKEVMAYLKMKGFSQARLQSLQEELQNTKSLNAFENSAAKYTEQYSKLRSWAYNSLDSYKHELLLVLYPVFLHCFMDLISKGHTQEARSFFQSFREDYDSLYYRDLQKLEGVLSSQHLEEMEFANSLRKNKVNIKMCQYSYELLIQFLHKGDHMLMLGIINEWINFKVSPGQPNTYSGEGEIISLVGSAQEAIEQINQKEIRWGMLENSLEERLEKQLEANKSEVEAREGDAEDGKKKAGDGGKSGGSSKKLKKDKVTSATSKGARMETNVRSAPQVKAELPLPSISMEVEQSVLEDLRNRVQVSSNALPSVSFYTFINTHNSLNCASVSQDGSLVVGGFSDSSLKVWNMTKTVEEHPGTENAVNQVDGLNENSATVGSGKRPYTLFQGHAGPVYAANFSLDGNYILSASADSTVRLWSRNFNSNLVCYKGHNYPVWDVQFSPYGHYFVTSSHDRSARLWTMERIYPIRVFAGHLSDVDCVQWHVNCNYIATGSSDKTVRLWDVRNGDCARVFLGHRATVLALAMSPDGRYIASGDEDGVIKLWDISTANCVNPLMGHSSCVWTLAFSCEGSILASGSADCTVKLWDVNASSKLPKAEEKGGATHRLRLLKSLPTKSSPVYTLRFSRRNLLFAAGAFTKNA